ncbi:hypothetical protein CRG98_003928, partial [Punica granatum]
TKQRIESGLTIGSRGSELLESGEALTCSRAERLDDFAVQQLVVEQDTKIASGGGRSWLEHQQLVVAGAKQLEQSSCKAPIEPLMLRFKAKWASIELQFFVTEGREGKKKNNKEEGTGWRWKRAGFGTTETGSGDEQPEVVVGEALDTQLWRESSSNRDEDSNVLFHQ